MRDTLFPAQSDHDRGNHSRDIDSIIDSIPSVRRRARLQTTAYLLGAREELPEVDDEEISHIRAIQLCYLPEANTEEQVTTHHQGPELQPQAFDKGSYDGLLKWLMQDTHVALVEFRVPLNTTDKNKYTTYVDYFYTESDHPLDMLDSMKATMNIPKTYEHLGWRLSTARRSDPPHRLLTSQDVASAFKAVRAEQASGRKKKKVVIEIVNTVSVF
jgi:hypothetical protein